MENIKVLISEEELVKREKELAEELYSVYGDEPVVFVTTLKGACPFSMDLAKRYKGDARFEFMRVSSYVGENSTGNVVVKIPLNEDAVKDMHAVIIEDIVDTGRTLTFMEEYVKKCGAKSVRTCTLLNKEARRVVDIHPDFIGFDIEDLFVVGYGLDYDERLRGLPYVGHIVNE